MSATPPSMRPVAATVATSTASAAASPGATHRAIPTGAALYMALVQFLFVTTWTVYAVFLPKLLTQAGLPPAWTPWILIFDQVVFMATDIWVGLGADRAQRTVGRLGPMIIGLTAVSCIAFLLMPHVVHLGAAAPWVGIALILVWAATSSALRAPPWVLLGKHAWRPALPRLNALMLLGLALGGAVAPYLGVTLKNLDPRLPFALSSLTLLAVTGGIVGVERRLAREAAARPGAGAEPPKPPRVLGGQHLVWMLGVLVLAAGFQVHASLNSAGEFLRFAKAADLEWLMPLFWVGFGLGMLPAGPLGKRFGALAAMAGAAVVGAVAAWAAAHASSLGLLVAAQFVAGAAWGTMLVGIFSSAADLGRTGREGLALGTMFSMLALATLSRIAATVAGLPKNPEAAPLLAIAPVALWTVGAVVATLLLQRAESRETRTAG
jgi:MFS family permease